MTCLNLHFLHHCIDRCAKASYLDKVASNVTGTRSLQESHRPIRGHGGQAGYAVDELHPDPLQSPIHAPTSAGQEHK